jgi:hypothetical protein
LDDTGWQEGPQRKALWAAATGLVAVFLIAEGKGFPCPELGGQRPGARGWLGYLGRPPSVPPSTVGYSDKLRGERRGHALDMALADRL